MQVVDQRLYIGIGALAVNAKRSPARPEVPTVGAPSETVRLLHRDA